MKRIFLAAFFLAPSIWAQCSATGNPTIPGIVCVANASSTGTTANTLTSVTGAPSTAIIATGGATGGVLGVTVAGAGTSGFAAIQVIGAAYLAMDGATTAGHYIQISSTNGDGHDAGATCPTSGGQVIGRVWTTNVGAGTDLVDLFPGEQTCGSGGSGANANGYYLVNQATNAPANAVEPFAVNPETTTYQVLAADFAAYKTITVASGTFNITLVASGSQPPTGQYIDIINYGSGTVTVPRSGQNINGVTTSQTIPAGSASAPNGLHVVSDGTNYFAQPFGGSSGSMVYPGVGIPISTGSAWGTSLSETDGDIIVGVSGTWTKGTALPNGITATTQSQADGSTKVSTTSYVDTGLGTKINNSLMTTLGDMIVENATPAPARLAGPTSPNGIAQFLSSTPSGGAATAQVWSIPGIPITVESGASQTLANTVAFTLLNNTHSGATTWAGFALANNLSFAFDNNGGAITFTPNSGTVNGAATQLIPPNYFGFHYTDNSTVTLMPVLPTLAAFTDCHATSSQFTFTASTGAFGCATLSNSSVGLSNVTNDAQTKAAVVPNTAPSAGQLLAGNAGGTAYAPVSMSQDCTITSAGVITCTKTNNVAFGTAATVSSTCAGDLSGTLPGCTVAQIEGGVIPTSAHVIGTNSSKQTVASTAGDLAAINWVAGGGTAQAQTATYSPAVASLVDGLTLCWKPTAANTATAPTFSPSSLTAHTVVKVPNATALVANDLITTQQACAIYDSTGTQWELQNPATASGGGGGTTTNALTANNSNSGAASGSTFNGSAAVTFSSNTFGAGSLANANTWSAANIFSVAAAASTPALSLTGAPFSGGTGTTTTPQFTIGNGAAVSTWSTSGTMKGINAASGFAGNFEDYHVNGGPSIFSVNYLGGTTVSQVAGTSTALAITNTTAATSSTSQSSPFDIRTGQFWYNPEFDTSSPPVAAASAADCWSHQVVETNGSNGASTYVISHNGAAPNCQGSPAVAEMQVPYAASYGVITNAIATPAAVTVAAQGTTGSTDYSYTVIACTGPACTNAPTATQITNGNASLGTSTIWNKITWSAVTGADYYEVYRTQAAGTTPTTTGGICLIPAGATLECDDKNLTADGTTVQAYNATGQVLVGTAPKVGGGTGGGMFGTTGTVPSTLLSTADGWYANSTNSCFDIVNGTTDVGCAAAPGVTTTFTALQTFTGGVANTTTPIRDQTRFVLGASMTAVSTAGVNIGSTGAGNAIFSWPVTAANWYDLECKLPVLFVASATIRFELVSISGSVTVSNVNAETWGNTGASAAFQDLTTIAGTTLATSETPATGTPGAVSEMISYNAQFLTSHAGNIGLEFVGNGTNNVQMLLGGMCGITQIN